MLRKNKSSKVVFTATHKQAKYTGNHPHLINTEGVYYFSTSQNSYIYRPNHEGNKSDWYRIFKENLQDIGD